MYALSGFLIGQNILKRKTAADALQKASAAASALQLFPEAGQNILQNQESIRALARYFYIFGFSKKADHGAVTFPRAES